MPSTSNADCFGSNSLDQGAVLQDSYFEHSGDDFVDILTENMVLGQRLDDQTIGVAAKQLGQAYARCEVTMLLQLLLWCRLSFKWFSPTQTCQAVRR